MRFLGNKTELLDSIYELLEEKNLLNEEYTFFDAFCGTGAVANKVKNNYQLVINDNLKFATIYSEGRIVANKCTFKKLGFNPFEYLNNSTESTNGFFYNNYSPAVGNRMYFTSSNAARIDFFRTKIEEWFLNNLLTSEEYCFLLASLIESVSSVSNTAGVYGAFLKHWDNRALKDIILLPVENESKNNLSLTVLNDKIENIVANVDCDIIYLDPPYTQNQYGTQYHILETLILYDNPTVSKITGSRPTAPMRSDWSKDIKSHILFDKIIAETKAKYIVFSYNNDGFMSKEFIESTLKRYGKPESYICRQINYKRYENWKSHNDNQHFEYLFFVEKKPKNEVVFESPLNYMGNKVKLIPFIRKQIPEGKEVFVDLFAGGFNVGINTNNSIVIYNDINPFVMNLIKSFYDTDTYDYIRYIRKKIKKYNLQPNGLDGYMAARTDYNSAPSEQRDPKFLYTLVMYGFHQQLRFNSKHEFNNPVGIRYFNDNLLEKMISFSREIKQKRLLFYAKDYKLIQEVAQENAIVYVDPPYCLTTGSYNDGKRGFNGWDKKQENSLFEFLDRLSDNKVPFILSYVADHKNHTNTELKDWIYNKKYKIIDCPTIKGISGQERKEVIILNYDN